MAKDKEVAPTEDFGVLIDRLDNLTHALNLPLRPDLHVRAMREALPQLVKDFKAEFVSATGENPWEGEPS